ncbi:MAG: hypothetical protein JRF05_05855 [Deltaproteobacteria bacterium]|jgi:hypothetical protein|nr:hypothetical protein [Deltaproteobacteria bacterium]
MKCEGTEDCPARKRPDLNCWEIANEMDDYRKAFNICKDCIVYMLKSDSSVLTKQEVQTIMNRKGNCALQLDIPGN